MQSINDVLSARMASIENAPEQDANSNTSIELPQEIKALITGSDYWVMLKTKRYLKLIREGHLDKLLHLAQLAQEKQSPANWFAAAASKARWEKYTLPYFEKLREVAKKADMVARRLGSSVSKFIYKQVWRSRQVERWAIEAAEIGEGKLAYFAWLCKHETEVLADRSTGGLNRAKVGV